ncbi:hypothetical protein JOD24_000829 [Kroppenstedtia sanguinis]
MGDWRESSVTAAWSKVPLLLTLFTFWFPMILVYGRSLFQTEMPQSTLQAIFSLTFYPLWIAVFIYYVVITSKMLAEAHGFESSWKGFAVYLVSKLVFVFPLLILFTILGAIS